MIVAGFGFRGNASPDSLRSALTKTSRAGEIEAIATPADKVTAPCLTTLAQQMNLPVIPVDPARLAEILTPTQSARVLALRGTGCVAEAAALAGAGTRPRLLTKRQISDDRFATCAIATGHTP